MTEKTWWETLKGEGTWMVDKVRELIHEGNVRRVVIQHEGRVVAEFPLTAGVVGAVLAPVVAAIGAVVALLKDCTIQVEKVERTEDKNPAANEAPRAATRL
jgi:D-aminopeptidase